MSTGHSRTPAPDSTASQSPAATGSAAEQRPRLPHLPALDGLRALAVIGVMLYHGLQNRFPGGFLGVDVFFVISGYLITSLLLVEWRREGRIDFKRFWLRRARRLLPALYVLLAGVLAFAVLVLPGEVARLRGNALAAAAYAANWYLVLHHESYFETVGRPSLFQHLWSLGVEEQFYLLWPPLFVLAQRRLGTRRAFAAALAGAAASTAWMAFLYRPELDPSRVYYGTDTRAAGLLVGCALALVWLPDGASGKAGGRLLDVTGLAALAGLAWFYLAVNEFNPLLYRGGFLLVALVSAALIAAAARPRARLVQRILGLQPLRWVGLRSYGIYLWHWPVFMLTRPQLDVPLDGLPLLALRVAATLLVAGLSYRYVETPIRTGALGRAWRAWQTANGSRRYGLGVRWATAAVALVLGMSALSMSVVRAEAPQPPAYLAVTSVDTAASAPTPPAEAAVPAAGQLPAGTGPAASPAAADPTEQAPGQQPAAAGPASRGLAAAGQAPEQAASSPAPTAPEPAPAGSDALPSPPAAQPAAGQAPEQRTSLPAPGDLLALQSPFARAVAGQAGQQVAPPTPAPSAGATPTPLPAPTASPPATAAPTPAAGGAGTAAPTASSPPTAAATPAAGGAGTAAPTASPPAYALGDSVMVGAAPVLEAALPGIEINARESRQVSEGIQVLQARRAAGPLPPVVIIHLGTNGTFTDQQFDEIMQILAGAPRVIFVNDKVPRSWEGPNNDVIARGVKRYPNAVLVDWFVASANHPEYFWPDGIHLPPSGATVYAGLIATAVRAP